MTVPRVRRSAIAGSWYPGNPRRLREEIEGYFSRIPEGPLGGDPVGMVVPHAGYAYSGQVAAYAYRQVMGRAFDAVILIGPSHRQPFRGVSVYAGGGFETPLGVVPIDEGLAEGILANGRDVSDTPDLHAQEHSLEIQLPFLQVAFGAFSLVPLMMGDQGTETCRALAGAILRAVGNRRVLIVGSSDLSHYHPYERALVLDRRALDHLERMDSEGLLQSLEAGLCEACGGGPAAVTMMAARGLGADRATLLKYANSGDVTGDRSGVVGYASLLYERTGHERTGRAG
ncbi:MAG: AmmeMemoRadiSam system protein B [Deltaproteobacteria bacterium]|nr:AmmeMemoRadiSam system protein B [Deltaproteobacteria bacterium]